MTRTMRYTIPLATAIVLLVPDAFAQLPQPSARSIGLAGAYGARARGYEAPYWNPANLALPDRPGWSLGLPSASGRLTNNSLSYGQIEDLYGEFIDDQTKSELLADIRRDDPNRMFEADLGIGASVLGLSIGGFAIGGGTTGVGIAHLSPDAMELLLFGNVGEDGSGRDFDMEGSRALAWGVSSAFISYGHRFTIPALELLGMEFSAGASLKYEIAHGLVQLRDEGTRLTNDPLQIDVAAEVLNSSDASAGTGWSVDLGAAMQWERLTAGLSVLHAMGDLSWQEEEFELTFARARADFDSATSTDTTLTFAELQPADQERVRTFLEDADFPTRLRLAGSYQLSQSVTLSADYEEKIGGELRAGWDRTFAAGAELDLIGALPLRVGGATNFEEVSYAGGLGLYAGPVHFDFSVGRERLGAGDGVIGALSISVWPGMRH